MEIIRDVLHKFRPGFAEIKLHADRLTLAKRRWRGVADDGREFGFDLDEPLHDGAAFFETEEHRYRIAQTPEPVLEMLPDKKIAGARIGWMVGNLHLPIEVDGDVMRVADDAAARQLCEREGIAFEAVERVFRPFHATAAHPHEHGHGHHHH